VGFVVPRPGETQSVPSPVKRDRVEQFAKNRRYFFLVLLAWRRPLSRSLIDRYMLGTLDNCGNELHRGCPVTDNCNSLTAEIDRREWPVCGVVCGAIHRVEPWDLGSAGRPNAPTALITTFASIVSCSPSGVRTVTCHDCDFSLYRAAVTSVRNRTRLSTA